MCFNAGMPYHNLVLHRMPDHNIYCDVLGGQDLNFIFCENARPELCLLLNAYVVSWERQTRIWSSFVTVKHHNFVFCLECQTTSWSDVLSRNRASK